MRNWLRWFWTPRSVPMLLISILPAYAFPGALGWPDAVSGIVGAQVVIAGQSVWRYVKETRRDGSDPAQIREVQRTGVPSGRRKIDAGALGTLEDELARAWRGRWASVLVFVIADALPIVAVLRGTTAWILLLLVVFPVQVRMARGPWTRAPLERVERLREAVGDPTPWWHYRPAETRTSA